MTSIVYLVPRATTAWDRDRWGFQLLAERGIVAHAVDLSIVLGTDGGQPNAADTRPTTRGEFSRFVRSTARSAVFIDYVRGISGPDLKTGWIFRELSKERAIYYVVAAGSLPSPPPTPRRLLRGLLRPMRALRHIASVASRQLAERFGGYVPPFRVFGPPAPAVAAFAARYGIPTDRLIATHSLDYDGLYRSGSVAQALEPCCVFIDDGLAGHPDFDVPGRSSADPTEYAATLKRAFDRIEAATGYPVVVAAHPRSDALRSDAVGGRTILRGRTADAVSASVLVIGHASTALGYAAIARKPVLLLGGRHVAAAGLTGAVSAMAAALGAPLIDPDDAVALSALEPDLSRVPLDKYAHYVAEHVRPSQAPEVSLWEVVARYAAQDLSDLS